MKKIILSLLVIFSMTFTSCDDKDTTIKQETTQAIQRTVSEEQKDIADYKKTHVVTQTQLDDFARSANYNPNYHRQQMDALRLAGSKYQTVCALSPTVNISVDGNGCYHLSSGSTHDSECHGAVWAQWNCFWWGE